MVWVNSDATLVTVTRLDSIVCSWNVQQGTLLHVLRTYCITLLRGSPHHSFVFAWGLDRAEFRVYDTEHGIDCTPRKEWSPTLASHSFHALVEETHRIWSLVHNLPVTLAPPAASFMPDGKALITAGSPMEGLTTWDLRALLECRGGSNEHVRSDNATDAMLMDLTAASLKRTQVRSHLFCSL